MSACIQFPKLFERQLAHKPRPVGQLIDTVVMKHDNSAGFAQASIEFHPVEGKLHGPLKTHKSILGGLMRRPPVSENEFFASQSLQHCIAEQIV